MSQLYYRRTDNSSYRDRIPLRIVRAESELSSLEKAYLSAVEKGDYASVKQALDEAEIYFKININCIDPLGRTALLIAIENENLEIIELLLSFNVYVGDALLHAIRKEVVGAVELLLNHKKPSGEKQVPPILLDKQFSDFTPDITPIILAAHTNNYEVIKLLVQKGVSVPQPHEVRCNCVDPSLIALSSEDPFLTAFQLSWELQELSKVENEFKSEYEELSQQCKRFAKDLLDQTRSSRELEMILNFSDDVNLLEEEGNYDLARLKLAIKYGQKEFVAQPNCQQLLATRWYDEFPGWRRRHWAVKLITCVFIGLLFPLFSLCYLVIPKSPYGLFIRKPFIKFICHTASYLTFLFLLLLASQHIVSTDPSRQGPAPTAVEWMILPWVLGFCWTEIKQMWDGGFQDYIHDWWNLMDFVMNSLYLATISLKIVAYVKYSNCKPREDWEMWHPTLVAEAMFAIANIFSSLRLISLFTANSHLGPLQISLGRMLLDILKFLFIYCLVLLAFANGLNQLYFYYETDEDTCKGIRCEHQNNAFSTLFETLQSLFWSIFGLISLYVTNVEGRPQVHRVCGCHHVRHVQHHLPVVLLNMLIAMMNNSYQHIADHADIEWKFARTKLWMSYFEEGGTLPSPFNIFPSPKSIWRVLRNLVKRYVAAMIRDAKTEEGLTEENFKELKQDISSFRYEVLGMMKHNKPSTLGGKLTGGSSSFVYPDHHFRYSPASTTGQDKSKLTLLQHNAAAGTSEANNGLSNGFPASSPSPGPASSPSPGPTPSPTPSLTDSKEKLPRKDFPKDISDFRLFQKCHKGKSSGLNPCTMYSVSEEAGESDPGNLPRQEEEGEKEEEEVVACQEEVGEEMERFLPEQTPKVDTCISSS
ncbi:hypothetical protein SKAU_G00085840 [Synaphobranchus kaupii]|uniref:Transient receptor ion channel domain-containing protein n=1 Tax=Synaphobranchus kaupii TaxID=118154 RepID=A0A9Q1FWL5_SYNKA|nr:hypothetical protein SKAU_G00085840 [Synaphobranchus kaupii]